MNLKTLLYCTFTVGMGLFTCYLGISSLNAETTANSNIESALMLMLTGIIIIISGSQIPLYKQIKELEERLDELTLYNQFSPKKS